MFYLQIAFRDFRVTRAVLDSPWVAGKFFEQLFSTAEFWTALRNTLTISVNKLVFGWPFPIVLALLLNEVRNNSLKRIYQTLIYLPHFISWVIIGGIIYSLTAIPDGLFNKMITELGGAPIVFLGQESMFQPILVISEIWKESGWGTIIYLAAITRISPELYEAANIDGASRFRQIMHVTLPGILDVVVILLIIRLGNILNVGFEQVLVLQNAMVMSVGDTLDTFVWRTGLLNGRYSFAAAAGLFKGVIASIMIFSADRVSKRLGQEGLL